MMGSEILKGGTDPIDRIQVGWGELVVDDIPIARGANFPGMRALAEWTCLCYRVSGYHCYNRGKPISEFHEPRSFKLAHWYPDHSGFPGGARIKSHALICQGVKS